jgi:gas vesicle protein
MGFGRFLLGLIIGGIAGAGLGLVLQPTPRGTGQTRRTGEPVFGPVALRLDRARKLLAQARTAFEQGRATVVHAGRGVGVTDEVAQTAMATGADTALAEGTPQRVAAVPERVTGGIQGLTAELKARWRQAVAEGKQAAAETEAELRRRYLEDTKRI